MVIQQGNGDCAPCQICPDKFLAEKAPVIFVSFGLQEHLLYAAAQAKRLSKPGSRVIVLTDTPFNIEGIEVHPIATYSRDSNEIAKYYKNCSNNPAWIELACIQRWFVLRDFMSTNGINSVIYLDSDVLLFSDFTGAFIPFNGYCFGLTTISAHISFFTLKVLEDLCPIFFAYYRDSEPGVTDFIQRHINSSPEAGPRNVCDMTFLNYFRQNTNHNQIELFQIFSNDAQPYFFDHNFNVHDLNFEMEDNSKKIIWKNGAPYAQLLKGGELVRLKCIHYQGPAKPFVKTHFEMTGHGSLQA